MSTGYTETIDVRLPGPVRARRSAFALTPLADVMFQLLIFFMLSTSLAPYALVPLGAPAAPSAPTTALPSSQGTVADPVIWHLSRDSIRMGRETYSLLALPIAIAKVEDLGADEILAFVSPGATTQDVTSVLEAVQVAGFAKVRLIGRPDGG